MTIICDSMAKHVHSIRHTTMQCFRGANIRQIQTVIQNDKPSSLTVQEIMSLYENLITYIRSRSYTRLIISAIIPRPCDSYSNAAVKRCKDVNKALENVCIKRKVQFLKSI